MFKIKNIIISFIFLFVFCLSNSFCVYASAGTNSSDNLKERIILLYNSNDIEETLRTISKIPENDRDSEIWFILANLTQDAGEDDDAIFYFQKSILTDKTNDKAYYNLGNLYLQREQYYSSIKMYKNAIKYKNDFAPYYYNLGCVYFTIGDFNKAKSNFRKAVLLNNSDATYRYNLALSYKKLGNTKAAQKELEIYNKLTQE